MLLFDPEILQDRVALAPVIGKMVTESLSKPGLEEEKFSYGEDQHQAGYLFYPQDEAQRHHSLVVYIHGGGWYSGHPGFYRFVGHFFADLGYPTLLAGYRLAPAHRHPAQIDDVSLGLGLGLERLAALGMAVKRIIVGGQSAGAQLAALLVYDRFAGQLPFSGYFGISGPLSFSDCANPALQKMITDMLGEGVELSAADPVQRLKPTAKTPALLIHGDHDPLVDAASSMAFASRLRRSGARAKVALVAGGRHVDLAAMFVKELPITLVFKAWLSARERKSIG